MTSKNEFQVLTDPRSDVSNEDSDEENTGDNKTKQSLRNNLILKKTVKAAIDCWQC
jgi:hypothetical protein